MQHVERSLMWLALACAILLGIALRLEHHDDVTSRSPDERVYTYNAQRIAIDGLGVMPELFKSYESSSANWIYVGPSRFGHVLLFAIAMKFSGVYDVRAGAFVSMLFSIFSLLLVAWIGIRFYEPWVAVGAVTFMAFSVGELGMSRRAWQDVIFGFFALVLVWLACEITRTPRKTWPYPLFFAMGSYSLITKETAWLSYGLCCLWVLSVWLWKERSVKGAALIAFGGVASIAFAFGILAALAGDAQLAFSAMYHSTASAAGDWAKTYCSGPWYQFPYLLWLVGPLTELLAAVGLVIFFVALKSPAWRERVERMPVAMMVLAFIGLSTFHPHLQYLRIISPADGPYCLLAAAGLFWLVSQSKRFLSVRYSRAFATVLFLAVAVEGVRDYRVYSDVVVRSGMEELAVTYIRGAMGR